MQTVSPLKSCVQVVFSIKENVMSSNNHNRRSEWFDNAYGGQKPQIPTVPSPTEAQAMIDHALWSLGIDYQKATDPEGWRHLSLGTAHGLINVIEWEPGVHFLVVWSPILRVPKDPGLRAELFENLLRLNHHDTGMARASLQDDLIVLSFVRPIHGLDLDEILDAIRMVMIAADILDEPLQSAFEIIMPQIEMDKATWRGVLDILRLCDTYTQGIFKYLFEGWVARKGTVTTGKNGVALRAKSASDKTLAALIGYASAGPLVTVGWDSLSRQWGIQEQDVAAFKQAVPRPRRFKITESSAHLPVDDSFTEAMAEQLLDTLAVLDKALKRAIPPPPPSLPDLEQDWGLKIEVGGATQRGIHALLESCPPQVQKVYSLLIQGWYDAGQKLYTNTLDRVALKLTVNNHTFGLCTLYGPQKAKTPRIELFYPLSYYFENREEARRRYEQAVARIPQFSPHTSGARIAMDDTFTTKSAENLLKILRRLAEDANATLST
jgi:hypothetical protein